VRQVDIMNSVRLVRLEELQDLLGLYKHLHIKDTEPTNNDGLEKEWRAICDDPNLYYLVIEEDGKLVSSCTLAIIKNLTRGAKPYGVIENVVTHKDYRKRGYGNAVLQKAVGLAVEKGCYKVMLMTGRKEERTLQFYEKAGFERETKTAFVKYL
jgi:GNAT superfamily N-acetyltransferase